MPRVKTLLYLYRVLMTGIRLMRAGVIEADLRKLNDEFALSWIPDLIRRKTTKTEKTTLDARELDFHLNECAKLRAELEASALHSRLPDFPSGVRALDDLLVRVRLNGIHALR